MNGKIRAAFVTIGLVLVFGGVGYSEMPSGDFRVGIAEAFIGVLLLMIGAPSNKTSHSAKRGY